HFLGFRTATEYKPAPSGSTYGPRVIHSYSYELAGDNRGKEIETRIQVKDGGGNWQLATYSSTDWASEPLFESSSGVMFPHSTTSRSCTQPVATSPTCDVSGVNMKVSTATYAVGFTYLTLPALYLLDHAD